jgi:hypothetical protein
MGQVVTEYGIRMGFTDFKASDGVGLNLLYLEQDDQARATEAFNQELDRAVKVIERGEKKDANGRIVGERAEILAHSVKPNPPHHAVIWTSGPTFHKISSSSIQDALELERIY